MASRRPAPMGRYAIRLAEAQGTAGVVVDGGMNGSGEGCDTDLSADRVGAMPSVDLVDETFVVVDREQIAAVVADPRRWRTWWPDLTLTVFMDRGVDGVRWSVTGALVGSSEIWLEPMSDGVLVHYYLRAEPTQPGSQTQPRTLPDSGRGRREIDRLRQRHATSWKVAVWSLKDELEGQRSPGLPGPR